MYEEQRGPVERRLLRAARSVSWRAKALLRVRRRIVVEIRWRLGDEIMALPIYEALRVAYPDCLLDVWCSFPELLRDNPFVSRMNEQRARPDRYICLRSGPRLVNRLEHYAGLAGVAVPSARPRLYYHDWHAPQLDLLTKPYVVFAPGASWTTKRWPLDAWRALGAAVKAMGLAVAEVGQTGEAVGVGENLTGRTTVREAACVLHAARLVVSCDSGPMHLARAAGTPVVALFGPTSPAILFRDDAGLYPVVGEAPCQGCWNRADVKDARGDERPGACPLGDPSCMASIGVADVLARVNEALGRAAGDL